MAGQMILCKLHEVFAQGGDQKPAGQALHYNIGPITGQGRVA